MKLSRASGLQSVQDNPSSFGHVASKGNVGDGPGGEDPQQLVTPAMNLDPSKLCYAPLDYSDEDPSMTEFINAAPFYSLLQNFEPPHMAQLCCMDSSVEEEMDVVQGWVAAHLCSDFLQSVKVENYIYHRVSRIWGSNDVDESIQPNDEWRSLSMDDFDLEEIQLISNRLSQLHV